jgi:hypothetical protein
MRLFNELRKISVKDNNLKSIACGDKVPRYKVTFSEISIKEMYVETSSEEKLLTDYKALTPEMLDFIGTATKVDGYYDRELLVAEVKEGEEDD